MRPEFTLYQVRELTIAALPKGGYVVSAGERAMMNSPLPLAAFTALEDALAFVHGEMSAAKQTESGH